MQGNSQVWQGWSLRIPPFFSWDLSSRRMIPEGGSADPAAVPPGEAAAEQPVTSPPPAMRFISVLLLVQQPRV